MVNIRKANRNDAQAIWEIRTISIRAQGCGHYDEPIIAAWTAGEASEHFMDAVEQYFHVADLDGRVVGSGMINLDNGKIDALFVHPDFFRRQIGRTLLTHLESLARANCIRVLTLESTLNAAPFYRSCGFVGDQIGQYHSPRGFSLDCVPMTKKLKVAA